jgi:hypothetical protein
MMMQHLHRGGSQELGPIAARSAHSELMGRQAAAAAARYSLSSPALQARQRAGSMPGLQAMQHDAGSLSRGGSGMSLLYDQFLGPINIPPIQTAAAPPGGCVCCVVRRKAVWAIVKVLLRCLFFFGERHMAPDVHVFKREQRHTYLAACGTLVTVMLNCLDPAFLQVVTIGQSRQAA